MNKHTATHNGFTYTRNSAGRTYSHVVLVKESRAADRVRCERNARDSWALNLGHHQEAAAGKVIRLGNRTYERTAEEVARSKAHLALGVEGYVAEALARFDARQPETLEADNDTYHSVAGWCGRPDLAMKLASQVGGFAVEAQVATTKPRAKAAA